jgi:SRSO17 transposase
VDVRHQPKWKISLDLLDDALAWGLPREVVVADAGYGDSIDFRKGLEVRGLSYIVGVTGTAVVWPPGISPKPPPKTRPGRGGRPKTRWTDPKGKAPKTMAELAKSLPEPAYRRITWREGTKGKQWNRFAFLRVRTAHRHAAGAPPGEEQWLICEWPKSKKEPTTFYLSNLPASTPKKRLVYLAKLRWRIERDYQELKGELGLDHFEGRGWRGFHHHVACVAAAHAFLTLQRSLFPPDDKTADVSALPVGASAGTAHAHRALSDVRA